MALLTKNKEETNNGRLSAVRPRDLNTKTDLNAKKGLQTILKQKSIIKIYVDDNKYYVEHAAAYALGLISVRAVIMDKPKLVEITPEMHNKLKAKDTIKIEYVRIEKKQTLKVYFDGSNYYIDNSAAYALGLLSVEEFSNPQSKYYCVTEEMVDKYKEQYNVEYYSLKLKEYSSDKKL